MAVFVLAAPPWRAQESPLLGALLCYGGGILCVEYLPALFRQFYGGYGTVVLLLAGFIGLGLCLRNRRYALLFYIYGAWLLLGIGMAQWVYLRYQPEEAFGSAATHSYRAYVLRPPVRDPDTRAYVADLQADLRYIGSQGFVPTANRVRLHYYASPFPFQVGDEFWIRGAPTRIAPTASHTEGHAYATTQARKGIYFQDHAGRRDLIATGRLRGYFLWIHAQRLQAHMRSRLTQYLSPASASLAQGLVLGQKSVMTASLREAFAATGSMHLLAVSGLHVGILYATWFFLAGFVPLGRYAWASRLWVAVVGLWGFAFVVGLSASVVRATTLCTLLVLGSWLGRRANPYNSLAAAALLILLFSPRALFSLSFQLSFLAVLGILLFYKFFYQLVAVRHKLSQAVWGMVCVSVAAQIAVLPLVIYHFQLFSWVFPLSSVLLTPGLFLILPLSLGVTLLSPWAAGAKLLAFVLEPLLQGMIWLTQYIARWPGSYLYPIYYDEGQLWLLYAAFFVGTCFLISRRPAYSLLCAGLLLAHGFLGWQRSYHAADTHFLRLNMDIKNKLLLQYSDRGIVYQTTAAETNVAAQRFLQQKGYSDALVPYPTAIAPLWPVVDGLLYATIIQGQRILWLTGHARKLQNELTHPYVLHTDYLVLSRQTQNDIAPLLAQFRFRKAILSGSTTRATEMLQATCACTPHLLGEVGPFYQNF